jgi:hypothetical protein
MANAAGRAPAQQCDTTTGPIPPATARRVRALILACSDPAAAEPLNVFLQNQHLTERCQLVHLPGGPLALATPDREAVLDECAMRVESYRPRELMLVVHHDCERFGGSQTFPGRHAEASSLENALAVAADIATRRFPGLQIRLARLDQRGTCSVTDHHPTPNDPTNGRDHQSC